ncbi:expressed unknown protein [Seminavis robusta]|uniref:Uncharacterized protein n=1 Tax=Seminavis robusta TaxID=568900 RepID=A0A9N8DDP8_9STRA|nr:expressed unknown protein [Seminavis robusta]|eukprot:Sro75_g041330.1 n/a (237) ;mRNA; f:87032-87742
MPPTPLPHDALLAIQQLLADKQFARVETTVRALLETYPNDLNLLSYLDQALYGLQKPPEELDELKTQIVKAWTDGYRSLWESQGRPKKLSSWARAQGESEKYSQIIVNEYYIPEDSGGIIAYFKVLAYPKSDGNKQRQPLPRLFKVETSAIALELGGSRPYVLREYFVTGGGGTTSYSFSKEELRCEKIMSDAVAFLDSNWTHVATIIPMTAPIGPANVSNDGCFSSFMKHCGLNK